MFRLLLVLFRLEGLSVEAKDDWTFSHYFHRISFCSRVYMYVHGMRYLHHEYMSSWILEDFGIFFEMRSQVSRLNFTRESSFGGTPLDWVLANVFEDFSRSSVVLSGCEQYKTARSKIYQQHRHSSLPLDQKFHFLTSQFWNKFNVICSTVWSSVPFLAKWRWWHIGGAPTNQHKTGSRPLNK